MAAGRTSIVTLLQAVLIAWVVLEILTRVATSDMLNIWLYASAQAGDEMILRARGLVQSGVWPNGGLQACSVAPKFLHMGEDDLR